uniref:Macro domain-containing protein n=1 Tax=viral metagenome TaxID=1070528 RepID=A0A6C0E8S9_9ZZZZ
MTSTLTLKFFDLYPKFEEELKFNFKNQTEFNLSNQNYKLKIETITCNILDLPEYLEPEKYPNVAFVSPANSHGWMNGGIDAPLADKVLPNVDKTLQHMLEELDYHGELEPGYSKKFLDYTINTIKSIFKHDKNLAKDAIQLLTNEGLHVDDSNFIDHINADFINKYFTRKTPDHHLPVGSAIIVKHQAKNQLLISAPTMFFPQDVRDTRNAYFAMIAVLKVVEKYNSVNSDKPITEILCPGLCTGVGGLSFTKLATQIHEAVLDFQKGIQDTNLNTQLVNSFESKFPGCLYLRESAFHQAPIKSGILAYTLRSMFYNYPHSMQLVDNHFINQYF